MENAPRKVALISGSSRGIGKAIATELGAAGIIPIINYVKSESEALSLRDTLRAAGCPAAAFKADVTDRRQVASMVEKIMGELGRIDILVNNAGITRDRTLKKISHEEWDAVLEVNLTGAFNLTKEVVPHMISQKRGAIINIASVIGQTGAVGQANYAASKAGLIGLTRSASLELARHNIRVNAVCPGFIETDMLGQVPPEIRDALLARIPLGRFGTAAEVAKAVTFLARDATYITGQCININGGMFNG